MLLSDPTLKLRIMQQQVGQLRPLLHQVEFGHAFRLALEFLGRNANQLAQHVTGVVESQRLVEVAGEQVVFDRLAAHTSIRFRRVAEDQ